MNENLKHIFLELMARYSGNELFNLKCWAEIKKQYSKKGRYYHTLSHLEAMIKLIDVADEPIVNQDVLLFSIFYHDIVYKATRSDNEHQSALVFQKRISKTSFSFIDKTMCQIELTKTHQPTSDFDTNFLLDIDLAVLGASPPVYKEYVLSIRKEYRMYPAILYNNGRKKVLEHFISKPHIFKTAYFRKNYELTARKNMKQEIQAFK